ncbi:MAG: type II toxin-antitoxin system prevent-host-death family antitoxin [Pseudomonadota bacterium]
MISVGAFEAKTHLSSLLEKVERGEEIVITRHGKPIARLIPERQAEKERIREAIAGMKQAAKGRTLGGLSWKELRDAGRK